MVGNLKKITVFFKFPTVFLRKKKEKVRVGAVSYTHLDVYKRQINYLMNISPEPFRLVAYRMH